MISVNILVTVLYFHSIVLALYNFHNIVVYVCGQVIKISSHTRDFVPTEVQKKHAGKIHMYLMDSVRSAVLLYCVFMKHHVTFLPQLLLFFALMC